MKKKILCISDVIVPVLYSPYIKDRFKDLDFIISCGDLPYYYVEFIVSMLDTPLYFVRGNHDSLIGKSELGEIFRPGGGVDLHRRILRKKDYLIAGVEGSIRYRVGPYMYSQSEMWAHVFRLIPGLMLNRLRYGRYLDIFVTHAPPRGVHDQTDLAHQGIGAFKWLIDIFKPRLLIHGHIHTYNRNECCDSVHNQTRVINAYGYKEINF